MAARRVLHVLASAEREHAAPARIVATLASALPGSCYALEACFLGSDGPLRTLLVEAGVPGVALGWRGIGDPIGAARFWRLLRARQPVIVHQHAGGPTVRAAIRLGSRARVVAHLHGWVPERGGLNLAAVLSHGADAALATSHAIAAHARGAIQVVHPGVPARAGPAEGSPDGNVVGAVGRLVGLKGYDLLIEAISGLPRARLEIAGDGPGRAELERIAARRGVDVRFLGWLDDPTTAMAGWDVFAQPSRAEGFGLAALEAMAVGLPVVASRVGGLIELVDDGRTGLLIAPGDTRALGVALGRLLDDPTVRRAMGAAARARAERLFSVSAMTDAVATVYAHVLR